ncbi:glycine-rich RNA-binding, abscisic acid-inducible protein-like [Selaginella moellendorffii]|uniref:glycine-rich RNA-binding, abscisic acid-inducible protein-like n=1 Tax=Selaginella moellendorffii TaxID=88036 RepID=UPI000D1C73DB|nr:glycine-rich RNA-binding, abscisic acid-inducible protein-like [Selaginella moellendorffii]|eukprot:XP_024525725.1 glycine-rich RNA-binding, abscisic acid-inducible protein-like [Selaginella moellendorffii]
MAEVEVEYRCFVGGLAWATDDISLGEAFKSFGDVIESKVINDRETGRSRGFGFVTFREEQSMKDAIELMNGKDLDGRNITVHQAQQRPAMSNANKSSRYGGSNNYSGGGGGGDRGYTNERGSGGYSDRGGYGGRRNGAGAGVPGGGGGGGPETGNGAGAAGGGGRRYGGARSDGRSDVDNWRRNE